MIFFGHATSFIQLNLYQPSALLGFALGANDLLQLFQNHPLAATELVEHLFWRYYLQITGMALGGLRFVIAGDGQKSNAVARLEIVGCQRPLMKHRLLIAGTEQTGCGLIGSAVQAENLGGFFGTSD